MPKSFFRILAVLLLTLTIPVQGMAAVTGAQCMALTHHPDGAVQETHAHAIDGAHEHDSASHTHAGDSGDKHDEGSNNHCGPCTACCASASIAGPAGLPILPGLARYSEVAQGRIDHALRFTVSRTRRAYVYPARHYASDLTDPALPPMGLRVRLKASFDVRGFPRQARIVLEALKRYGMLVADNGSSWYISGAPDPRWSNDDLHQLGRVKGSDFEVVDTSSLRPRSP